MAHEIAGTGAPRPGWLRRAAAGAWQVPAGFSFLVRRPGLWPLAALPTLLAMLLIVAGAVLGIYLLPAATSVLGPRPGSVPEWIELPISLLLWVTTVGGGMFLGLGVALLLASPLLDQLSRRVELRAGGRAGDSERGLRHEIGQAIRGALYFLVAAPGVVLLGMIPVAGPALSLAWGGWAIAFQMTDPALTRRGLSFADKRRWHRDWLFESEGFGLAGMLGLLVPFANLLLAPVLVTAGTLLVLDLERVQEARPRGPGAGRVENAPG